MTDRRDIRYYRDRMLQEEVAAMRATSPRPAQVHLDLAASYRTQVHAVTRWSGFAQPMRDGPIR